MPTKKIIKKTQKRKSKAKPASKKNKKPAKYLKIKSKKISAPKSPVEILSYPKIAQPKKIITEKNTDPIIESPKPALNSQPQALIQKTNSKLSPYVLDLKKTQADKTSKESEKNEHAEIISGEIFNLITQKRNNLIKNFRIFSKKIVWPSFKIIKLSSKNNILKKTEQPKSSRIKLPGLKINKPAFKFQLPQVLSSEIRFGHFIIPTYWKKAILSFSFLCLVLILPFIIYDHYQNLQGKKNDVLQKTSQALSHLVLSEKAASAQDFYYTEQELLAASQNFNQAQKDLDSVNFIIQNIIKFVPDIGKQYANAQKLVDIGEKLSKSAAILTAAYDQININDNVKNLELTDKLNNLKESLNLIAPDLKQVDQELQTIDLAEIPEQYKDKIQLLQTTFPLLEKNIENFTSSADLILKFLGQDSKKRYLLLFQNNHELRPTGGFIGSFALADIDRGNLEKINIPGGGPYDLKSGLTVNIEAPKPLVIMNPRWEFQDANWFPNLPDSAEKLMWFYEKSGGTTVDGLIFINASFLKKILNITGPIELPAYNKTITADNFFQEVQENVEQDYDKAENKPKQIIADLAPLIINRLLHSDRQKLSEILDLLLASLNEKDIQLYFSNYSLEKMVLNNNWGGQLKDNDKDYLAIIDTNIAGEKTDAKIEQTAELTVNINQDGSITNNLKITKTHNGKEGEPFYGVPNLDYLRIYVPNDSQLISASGFEQMPPELFNLIDPGIYKKDPDLNSQEQSKQIDLQSQTEIYNESGKTVFANWLKVLPGETKTVSLEYKLPFKLNLEEADFQPSYFGILKQELQSYTSNQLEKYSLLWQKQSGKENFKINIKIKMPQNLNYQIIYPDNLIKDRNTFNFTDYLNVDKFLALVFNNH